MPKAPRGPMVCMTCDKEFNVVPVDGPRPQYCSKNCYAYKDKKTNPIRHKARTFSSATVGIKNSLDFFEGFVEMHLGEPCKYCSTVLTLTNVSLDHMEPLNRSGKRWKTKENYEYRVFMDRPENLQLICRGCNGVKSNFSDKQFVALLAFLHQDPDLEKKLLGRLSRSNAIWKRKFNKEGA